MIEFVFTNYAKDQFDKLEDNIQSRILEKLKQLKDQNMIKNFLKPLINLKPATHRLRIGDYRLILQCDTKINQYIVLKIGHRRDVYRYTITKTH